jgi:FkbM family methyltransferase
MMKFLKWLREKALLFFAQGVMRDNANLYPRLAVVTGDYISLKAMLLGRFEDRQLRTLAAKVFPLIRSTSCLDVGANIGNHSVAFAQHFKKVYAFEPNPAAFDLLSVNAKWYPAIEPIALGASDHEFMARAVIPSGNQGAARISDKDKSTSESVIEFECVRIDEYLSPIQWLDIGFIKLDIEGHELQALQGCRRIIEASKPMITFELLRKDHGFSQDIEHLLKSWGYSYFYEVSSDLRRVHKLEKKNYKMILAVHSPLAALQ